MDDLLGGLIGRCSRSGLEERGQPVPFLHPELRLLSQIYCQQREMTRQGRYISSQSSPLEYAYLKPSGGVV